MNNKPIDISLSKYKQSLCVLYTLGFVMILAVLTYFFIKSYYEEKVDLPQPANVNPIIAEYRQN
jgi:hypothetical protein